MRSRRRRLLPRQVQEFQGLPEFDGSEWPLCLLVTDAPNDPDAGMGPDLLASIKKTDHALLPSVLLSEDHMGKTNLDAPSADVEHKTLCEVETERPHGDSQPILRPQLEAGVRAPFGWTFSSHRSDACVRGSIYRKTRCGRTHLKPVNDVRRRFLGSDGMGTGAAGIFCATWETVPVPTPFPVQAFLP